MREKDDEEERLRSVALKNARSVLLARQRAEEALRQQSEWLRTTLASIADAVISTDAEGRVTFLNRVAADLTGWPQAEAEGRPLADVFRVIDERDRRPIEGPASRALREGAIVGKAGPMALIGKDGTERPIDASAAPIREGAGPPFGAVLVFRDSTERRRAEQAHAESARLAALRADVALALTAGGGLREALRRAAEALVRHLGAAFARVWVLDEAAGVLHLQASAGLYSNLDGPHSRFPVGENLIGTIASTRQPYLTNALADEPRVADPHWARREGLVAFAGYPLAVEGRLVGVLALFARQPLSETVLAELAPLADGVAQCIERVRSEQALRESEARHRFLADLAKATQALTDPDEVVAVTARMLGQHLNADRCAFAEIEGGAVAVVTGHYAAGAKSLPDRWPLASFGDRLPRALRANELYVVDDVSADPSLSPEGADALRRADALAMVCAPLHKEGRLAALVAVQQRAPRHWAPEEVALVRSVVGFCSEALERARVTRTLRESEARYRAMVEATPECVKVVAPDGTLLQMNPAGLAMVEAPGAEAVLGRCVYNVIAPEHRGAFRDLNERVCRGERAALQYEIVGLGGTRRHLETAAVPLPAPGGGFHHLGVTRDVTHRVAAERELRESEERYRRAAAEAAEAARANAKFRAFFEQGTNFAGVLALDGTVVEANRLSLDACGLTREEVIGRPFWECGWWDRSPALRAMVQGACRQAAAGQLFRTETPYFVASGDERFVDLILAPVTDEAGRALFIAATGTDVTERRQMEDALRQADRKKDEFLALLAHELRNPLAPLRNGLQVMRLASGDPAAVAQARAMMERQLGHMIRLIDDLLDVSRISRNKMELRRSRVLLADAVMSAVETARPAIEAAGHELALSLPPDPVPLDADLTRLAQVISNLLTNSAKYTDRGGRIWLTAEVRGGEVVLSVRDSGIGIPADSLPHIFDMFSQVDRSIERSTGGLGIGLALVKGLVEMHGGTVAAASPGPGQGSTFTVTLPLPGSPAVPRPDAPGDTGGHGAGPKRRILVVDDNRDSGASMAMMLQLLGNEVRLAHDGVEAIEAAEAFHPQVILMDVGMPRLNGLDATRRIRAHPWGKDLAIIAVTGWGHDHDRSRSRDAGCDGHLVKPVNLTDLEKLLAEVTREAR